MLCNARMRRFVCKNTAVVLIFGSPAMVAIRNRRLSLLQFFLDCRCKMSISHVDAYGNTLWHYAAGNINALCFFTSRLRYSASSSDIRWALEKSTVLYLRAHTEPAQLSKSLSVFTGYLERAHGLCKVLVHKKTLDDNCFLIWPTRCHKNWFSGSSYVFSKKTLRWKC